MLLRQSLRFRFPLRCTPLLHSRAPLRPESTASILHPPDKVLSTSPADDALPATMLYHGPLAPTFKRLKIFSLSSLTLCVAMAPLMFAVETNLPWAARAGLAATAVGTSSVSTALIGWAGARYVTALRITPAPGDNTVAELELTTLTLRLRPRITRVFDPAFVVPTSRPFAKWELADLVQLPPSMNRTATPGTAETVAETTDESGRVLGRWVVTWGNAGEGNCHAEGRIIR
ncbi:hypothetical protein B0H10DRAFT_1772876 [Mycena sp. CBHHK59/15]|nr:hypothetical protein B0H10DRAFT_1772876 [Mycena sp. CBHHK59/15]